VVIDGESQRELYKHLQLRSRPISASFWWTLAIIVFLLVAGYLIHRFFGDKLNVKPEYKREALQVTKIVLDASNDRQEIRVPIEREVIFDHARFPKESYPLPETGKLVDVSPKGMAVVTVFDFPVATDIVFSVLETAVASSPLLTGQVMSTRPYLEELPQDSPPLFLSCLSLKNLNAEAQSYVDGLVMEGQRKILTERREKKKKIKENSDNSDKA
jgi:hypothetical protein